MTLKRIPAYQAKIISSIALALFPLASSFGQTKPQITQEAVTATCSNVVVTGGTVRFQCSGLTQEQAKLLKDVPALLTRLLKSQQLDTSEILSRLDKCVDQGASRELSSEVQNNLKSHLELPIPNRFSVLIEVPNSTPESSDMPNKSEMYLSLPGGMLDPFLIL